jgi:transposase InsO family protein
MKRQTHLTAQQIADLKLEGMPTSARRVLAWADRYQWEYQQKARQQGGRHFAISSLPASAQADLKARWAGQRKARPTASNTHDGKGRPSWWAAHPEVADAVQACLAVHKWSASVIMEMLATEFVELPSARSLRRFIAAYEKANKPLLASLRDPDAFKNKFRASVGTMSGSALYAHHMWEIDTTPADVMTTEGRKAVLGIVDRYSRRARFMVCKSESAQSVRRFLIDTIRAWGVMPTIIFTDQGSGFINKSIKSALEILGIDLHDLPPARPDLKPFVERVFGTFTRQRAEIMPGYIGHNVAEAQVLRARARKATGKPVIVAQMSADQLQEALDNWASGPYYQRNHSTLKMSPMAKEQSSRRLAARAPDEQTLTKALSALVGPRIVGKRGIAWNGGRYWSAECAAYIGRSVVVRRDEEDLGALFIFDAEDRTFIGTAVNVQRSGLSEQEFARQARADQAQLLKVQRAELLAKQRRFKPEQAALNVLMADAKAAGKLSTLPVARNARNDAAVADQARAVPAEPKRTRKASTKGQADAPATSWAEMNISQRVAHVDALLAAHARGEAVDAEEVAWARSFTESTSYQAEKIMIAHFAPRSVQPAPTDFTNTAAGQMSGKAG